MEEKNLDGELARQAREGDSRAYEELVRRWACRVTAICHGKTGRRDVAEELAQESLFRGFKGIASLQEPEKFGYWLCGIATRVCFDWIKSKDRSHLQFGSLPAEQNPEQFLQDDAKEKRDEESEEREHMMSAVESLPEIYREVLMLFYYEEMKYHEIARLLGLSDAAVNARLTKARVMLREKLTRSRSSP